MATRRLVTRSKGRLTGIRSALRVALFPFILAPRSKGSVRLQPLPVTAPAAVPSVRRERHTRDPVTAARIEEHYGPFSAAIYRACPTVEVSPEWQRILGRA